MNEHTEKSCYWSHFGHQRNPCPTCADLPACPVCGSMDRMKIVCPTSYPNSKWVRCYSCDHQSETYGTFEEAMKEFYEV